MAIASKRARGRPSEGAREALVEASRELFMERDYGDVSTGEILERSGVSRGALYHHFASKRDLFKVVFETGERRILGLVIERAMAAGSPFAALLESTRAYLQLCETDEELRRIGLLQSRVVLGWEGWRAAATELGIGVALAAVSAAIEAGELVPHDPEMTAIILLGAMIEAATLIAVAPDRRAARERSEAIVVDLLEGLRR
ncbi:MAG TPA: helix-turn-helix domain-containing protein [Solirubrobacterales bacterium]|nr:helix-turn-helix domain-containing protein [Solirubrobacterales bacterium]